MSYYERIGNIKCDEPSEVVKAIKGFIDNSDLIDEQKLFGIGLILNKNKEHYIKALKTEIDRLRWQLDEKKKTISENITKNMLQTEMKKKIVVKKK